MFAAKHSDRLVPFTQVHPTATQVRICGYEVSAVDVKELSAEQPGCYFAWKTAEGSLRMIQPSMVQMKMCSPDAFESAIRRGEGRIVPVSVVGAATD